MNHEPFLKRRKSDNPEDVYVWTPELKENIEFEECSAELFEKLKAGHSPREPELPRVDMTPEVSQETPEEVTEETAEESSEADVIEQIKAIIPSLNEVLDYAKPSPFNGMVATPKVAVVSEKLGFKVTSAQIQEAMKG